MLRCRVGVRAEMGTSAVERGALRHAPYLAAVRTEYNIAPMLILALDTSTSPGSISVADEQTSEVVSGNAAKGTHAERLPADAIAVLAARGRRLANVEIFAIVSGPGSFTGLRVGIACVQGWALAGGQRTIGIPTLDAMLMSWLDATPHRQRETLVVACLDGQRGEVFFAGFGVPAGAVWPEDCAVELAAGVERPDRLRASIDEIRRGRPVFVVGDGAMRYAEILSSLTDQIATTPLPAPLAAAAARLAAHRHADAGAPHALQPIYIRRPDAVIARERARAQADHAG